MNYQKIYDTLIHRALTSSRKKLKPNHPDYIAYELHHIIPECLFKNRVRKGPSGHLEGNPNSKENLVLLTPEEHYLAHQLLVKIYPGNHKLVRAAIMLCTQPNGVRSTNKIYGWLRKLNAIACHHMQIGVKTGPNKKKGRKGAKSEKKGTTIGPRPRLICPYCAKEGATPGIILFHFDKCRLNPNLTEPYISPLKDRIIKEYTCTHCGKIGKGNSMKQWHFDNCKFREPTPLS